MRQSDRDARFARCLARILPTGGSLLAIGRALRFSSAACQHLPSVDGLSADDGVRHQGALLWVDDAASLTHALSRLLRHLDDGASVVLVTPSRVRVGARLVGLMTREAPTLVAIADLCGAMLAHGLCTPRVHADVPDLTLVAASIPTPRDALDDFFAQPWEATRR